MKALRFVPFLPGIPTVASEVEIFTLGVCWRSFCLILVLGSRNTLTSGVRLHVSVPSSPNP